MPRPDGTRTCSSLDKSGNGTFQPVKHSIKILIQHIFEIDIRLQAIFRNHSYTASRKAEAFPQAFPICAGVLCLSAVSSQRRTLKWVVLYCTTMTIASRTYSIATTACNINSNHGCQLQHKPPATAIHGLHPVLNTMDQSICRCSVQAAVKQYVHRTALPKMCTTVLQRSTCHWQQARTAALQGHQRLCRQAAAQQDSILCPVAAATAASSGRKPRPACQFLC